MSVTRTLLELATDAARFFRSGLNDFRLSVLGDGQINDTFLVACNGDRVIYYVLQRINRQVFPQPELIMANLRTLVSHLDQRLRVDADEHFSGWEVVRPIYAKDGSYWYIDAEENFWRMLSYVGAADNFNRVKNHAQAREAGRALGLFHRLVWDLPPARLADTLPGFHVTPGYLAEYDRLIRRSPGKITSGDEDYCQRVIEEQRTFVPVLEKAISQGVLPVRVIHGDPKLSNIMFAQKSGRAICLVDLDTVKPGALHYDIGDCLRSCCDQGCTASSGNDNALFDIDVCRNLLSGYLAEMAALLTEVDYEFIYPAFKLITFELGLRFFSDHLAGDIYFKTENGGQNLSRALSQFKLLACIEDSETVIRDIVEECRQSNDSDT